MKPTMFGPRKTSILNIIKSNPGISSIDIRMAYDSQHGMDSPKSSVSAILSKLTTSQVVRREKVLCKDCNYFYRYWLLEPVEPVIATVDSKSISTLAGYIARRLRHVAGQQEQRKLGPEIVDLLLTAAIAIEAGGV